MQLCLTIVLGNAIVLPPRQKDTFKHNLQLIYNAVDLW